MTTGERLTVWFLIRLPRYVPVLRPLAARIAQRFANHRRVRESTRVRLAHAYHANMPRRAIQVLLKDGFRMSVVGEDCIQRRIMLYGPFQERVWEPNTTLLLGRLAGLGRRFLVAGGHVGYFPLLLSATGHADSVICTFEPNERQRGQLANNLAMNGARNVRLDQRALSDQTGRTVEFYSDSDSNVCSSLVVKGAASQVTKVTTVRIDDYCAATGIDGFDLIFLDIEGGEPEAIRGAGELLNRPSESAPDLLFELVPGRRPPEIQDALLTELASLGYELFLIDDYFNNEVASATLDEQVSLLPIDPPTVAQLASIARSRTLRDPNVFATKRGVERLGSVVRIGTVRRCVAESMPSPAGSGA